MDKLTLEHLAPYLPYELKVRSNHGTIYKMGLYNDMKGSGIETRTIDQCLDMKPLLRPLDQLTKEIEHKGKLFVPIIELFNSWYGAEPDQIILADGEGPFYGFDGYLDKTRSSIFSFYYNSVLQSFIFLENSKPRKRVRQRPMFQKLVEWHFDLDGLIDKELAIPIS